MEQQPVAIKPIGTGREAATEYLKAFDINGLGLDGHDNVSDQPVTYVPIGFHRSIAEPDSLCVLTKFEKGVRSFDNIFWQDEPPTEDQVRYGLMHAAAALIFLHANAYTHNDYSAKNTASDPLGARVIDITTARKEKDLGDDAAAAERFIGDVSQYIASLNLRSEDPENPHVTACQMQAHFLDYYQDSVSDIYPLLLRSTIKSRIDRLDLS